MTSKLARSTTYPFRRACHIKRVLFQVVVVLLMVGTNVPPLEIYAASALAALVIIYLLTPFKWFRFPSLHREE